MVTPFCANKLFALKNNTIKKIFDCNPDDNIIDTLGQFVYFTSSNSIWQVYSVATKKKQYGYIRFLNHYFKFKAHRLLPPTAKLCQSDFTQDNKGNWYLNLTYEYIEKVKRRKHKAVAIDLNLTEEKQIILSDGRPMSRVNLTAEKEKLTNKIHKKIYNIKYNQEQQTVLAKKKELNTNTNTHTNTHTHQHTNTPTHQHSHTLS